MKPGGAAAVDITSAAMAAAKLGMMDKLLAAVEKQPSLAQSRDGEGAIGRSRNSSVVCTRSNGVCCISRRSYLLALRCRVWSRGVCGAFVGEAF